MPNSMLLQGCMVSVLLTLTASPLVSQQSGLFQELGVFAIAGSSNHSELPSPVGVGASTYWSFGGNWMARLSYHRVSDETVKDGTVCRQYSQRIDCRTESTTTSVAFSGLRGALLGAVHLGDQARIGLGGGFSFNQLHAESVGESGLLADLLAPNTGQIGYLGILSVDVTPFPRVPVKLIGGFTAHWVNFNTCSGEDPPQHDPFCGMEVMRELEVGLSYAF
ncbi:hypothetical protein ACFL0I_00940 [Gemmatimonadota bacterium]